MSKGQRALLRDLLLSLPLGVLLTLSFAPFDLWWLSLFSLAGLRLWTMNVDRSTVLIRYYGFGLGAFGTGISWIFVSIHEYGGASVWLALVMVTLFVFAWSLTFLPQAWLLNTLERAPRTAGGHWFAVTWALGELLRSHLLTGFPWLLVGYGHLETLWSGWAPVGSVYLVGFFVALSAELVVRAIKSASWSRTVPHISLLVLILGSSILMSSLAWVLPGEKRSVAGVQGNLDQHTKWYAHQFRENFDRHWQPTLGLRNVSLVVWPEAAFTDFQQNRERLIRAMDEEMIRREAGLILGIPGRDDEGYTNTALGLGKAQGQYIKRHLVPFGEYVPLESWLRGVITFFDLPMSRNQPGPREQAPLTLNGITLGLSICYEIAYPELVRSAARDPGLLVTISNDTWFGDSIGPWQHLQIAQMRALEMGRDLLRVTNNGVTALIDATGKQIAMLPRNEPGVLVGEVSMYEGKTPFQTWGYRFLWTVLMVAFFANVLWVWLAKQKRRSGFPHAQESDEVELPPSKKGP